MSDIVVVKITLRFVQLSYSLYDPCVSFIIHTIEAS